MPQHSKKQFLTNAKWTSLVNRKDWRHYRICGIRLKEDKSKEYEMMAVCDRKVRFWVTPQELGSVNDWTTGWL